MTTSKNDDMVTIVGGDKEGKNNHKNKVSNKVKAKEKKRSFKHPEESQHKLRKEDLL